jgi:hypothetical protein
VDCGCVEVALVLLVETQLLSIRLKIRLEEMLAWLVIGFSWRFADKDENEVVQELFQTLAIVQFVQRIIFLQIVVQQDEEFFLEEEVKMRHDTRM